MFFDARRDIQRERLGIDRERAGETQTADARDCVGLQGWVESGDRLEAAGELKNRSYYSARFMEQLVPVIIESHAKNQYRET
jgi:hypothetical protein